MYADLAEKYGVPLYPDFLCGLRAEAGTQDGVSAFLQADGIHPNSEGVAADHRGHRACSARACRRGPVAAAGADWLRKQKWAPRKGRPFQHAE